MNPLAKELNDILIKSNPYTYEMLSDVGKELYFPKGILTQSAEAKEKANKFNATIGMASEKGEVMHFSSVMSMISGLKADETISYAPSYGIMSLRKAWKDSIIDKNPTLKGKDISIPVVTNAITHGLAVVSEMWVNPGDAIIIPDMMWGNYRMIFEVRRSAKIVQHPLFDADCRLNLKAFEECVAREAGKREKVIVLLNFPNNPTGYSITREEGDRIADILTKTARSGKNVIAVTDDAYFGLFYEEEVMKESIFSLLADRDPRLMAIKLDGATKEIYVWGLRVGCITYGTVVNGPSRPFYEALEKKTAGDVRGTISNASHLSQTIVLNSLESDIFPKERDEKFALMKNRAMELKEVLKDPKYAKVWDMYPFNSGYFMCIRVKTVDAEALRIHLLDKYGVGLISLGKTDLRIAFSCIEKEDIRELFDLIYRGIQDLTK
ncbi:MAG: aminotransferase class I/II-fold pyridoxal phosphate-dependent enzyme [Deltaproteobacteria bacterium]|nr:aminotransferase class I/II-fold pyridoxal phosphate-dependent enzyme [Deltaproteobacteria bacterium]